jgi:hypothetical protein
MQGCSCKQGWHEAFSTNGIFANANLLLLLLLLQLAGEAVYIDEGSSTVFY